MNLIEDVMSLLGRVPAPPEDSMPVGLSTEQIEEFEASQGFKIPDRLREWLSTANGPCIGPGGIVGLGTKRSSQDASRILEIYPEWRDKGWIPIAGDGCGNYYVVATKNEYGKGEPVLFIDVNIDRSRPVFVAASNTWFFLRFLLRKELDESKWPYSEVDVVREDPEITIFVGVSLPWDVQY